MSLVVESRRKAEAGLHKRYGAEALLLDLTSKGALPWQRFSPFYPHGGIPVPYSPGFYGQSVEGIWQGLKVFESADVDRSKLTITNMKNIKRTTRTNGRVLGHRAGLYGERLLNYAEARREIYLPSYKWILEQRLQDLLGQLKQLSLTTAVLLLDYETNCDIADLSSPLSHASLVKRYLDGDWPS
jgi:hypothetical protein